MERYIRVLSRSSLFKGVSEAEIGAIFKELSPHLKKYPEGSGILNAGDEVKKIYVIVSGQAQIFRDDILGNRSIITNIFEGDMFGEAFVCAESKNIPLNVWAISDVEALLLDYQGILKLGESFKSVKDKLSENMLVILSNKNIILNNKIAHISKKTIRERVLSYLMEQANLKQKNKFKIPFDRQELADYLCVDRSALSKELGKLRDEGIITFRKNLFEILI